MNVLVTGGAGFIGSHTIVELIQYGYNPVIIDNFCNSSIDVISRLEEITKQKITYYEADCTNRQIVSKILIDEKIDGVIHFAAYKAVGESVENPLKYYQNNVAGLLDIIAAMQNAGCSKLVFSSSCTVYGEPEEVPVTENTPRQPANSPYGNTKSICEDILKDIAVSGLDFQSVALRYFNPIGAHESGLIGELPNGVPSNLVPYITQTAAGLRDKLTVFGKDYETPDGTNIRDFIHVVDLAKAHTVALKYLLEKEGAFYDIFNLGTGVGNSVQELIDTFEKVNNLKLNYTYGPRRPGDTVKIFGDVQKAAKILNWKTEKSLEDALKDAWRWQQNL